MTSGWKFHGFHSRQVDNIQKDLKKLQVSVAKTLCSKQHLPRKWIAYTSLVFFFDISSDQLTLVVCCIWGMKYSP